MHINRLKLLFLEMTKVMKQPPMVCVLAMEKIHFSLIFTVELSKIEIFIIGYWSTHTNTVQSYDERWRMYISQLKENDHRVSYRFGPSCGSASFFSNFSCFLILNTQLTTYPHINVSWFSTYAHVYAVLFHWLFFFSRDLKTFWTSQITRKKVPYIKFQPREVFYLRFFISNI